MRQRPGIGQAQVQALAGQRMHHVRGIARQHPARAAPAVGLRQLQRPGRALAGQRQLARRAPLAGLQPRPRSAAVVQRQQLVGARSSWTDQTSATEFALRAAQGQQGQRCRRRRTIAAPPGRAVFQTAAARRWRAAGRMSPGNATPNRPAWRWPCLRTPPSARPAAARRSNSHLRLVAQGVGQACLQRLRHRRSRPAPARLGPARRSAPAAFVAIHVHVVHRRGVLLIGPGAQRSQQFARGGIQRVGAHVARRRRRRARCRAPGPPAAGRAPAAGPACGRRCRRRGYRHRGQAPWLAIVGGGAQLRLT